MTPTANPTPSPWPHRLAVLVACATFPLIWVGGLVTTYDAGMAVPDWPTTYGYNLFLYPWQTWLFGPWDLFIEHGHRLLGATVGILTIALTICVWKRDERRWLRWLALGALAGVVFQGILGGLRVRLDERLFAQIHACVGPAFFAFAAAISTFTSKPWFVGWDKLALASAGPPNETLVGRREPRLAGPTLPNAAASRLPRLSTTMAAMVYVQVLLGSQLRHVQVTADASVFRIAVWFHLLVAAALAAHVAMLWARSLREAPGNAWLRRPANLLVGLIGVQLALGCGAWVVNYGWPAWLSGYRLAAGYVVRRESFLQATLTTAHVATGSLILAVAVVLALRAWRTAAVQKASGVRSQASGEMRGGVASSSPPSSFSPSLRLSSMEAVA